MAERVAGMQKTLPGVREPAAGRGGREQGRLQRGRRRAAARATRGEARIARRRNAWLMKWLLSCLRRRNVPRVFLRRRQGLGR